MRTCDKPGDRFWNFVSIYYTVEDMNNLKFQMHLICIILNILTIPNQVHNFPNRAIIVPNLQFLDMTVSEKNSGQNLAVKKKERKRIRGKTKCLC